MWIVLNQGLLEYYSKTKQGFKEKTTNFRLDHLRHFLIII